jgi:anti-sigma regulatory factor (Ser/Thr protein kinase)
MVSVMDHGQPLAAPAEPAHHGRFISSAIARRDTQILPASDESVPAARHHARQVLRSWGFAPELSGDVRLVVSELVTNAVQASQAVRPLATPVHVILAHGGRWLVVTVADASPKFPLLLPPSDGAPGGRGLEIVAAFSTRWGWHPVAFPGLLKAVWAEWAMD